MRTEENIAYMKTPIQQVLRETYDNVPNLCQQVLPGSSKRRLDAFEQGEPLESMDHRAQYFMSALTKPQPSPYEKPQSAFDMSTDGPIYSIPDY